MTSPWGDRSILKAVFLLAKKHFASRTCDGGSCYDDFVRWVVNVLSNYSERVRLLAWLVKIYSLPYSNRQELLAVVSVNTWILIAEFSLGVAAWCDTDGLIAYQNSKYIFLLKLHYLCFFDCIALRCLNWQYSFVRCYQKSVLEIEIHFVASRQ